MPKLGSYPSAAPAALDDVLAAIRSGANKTLTVEDILTAAHLLTDGAPAQTTDEVAINRAGSPLKVTVQDVLDLLPTTNWYRHLSGFEPDKLSTHVLNINPGSCANSNGTQLFSSDSVFTVDLSTTGAGGLDTGTVADGSQYGVYLIADSSNALSAVASLSTTYGGVTAPAGYTMVRKLPFAFTYSAANWDGIHDFHLSSWPQPFVRFTGAEETATWRALNSGTATTFTDVDLSPWIPDGARMAYLGCRVDTPSAATPGFAALRVLSTQSAGWSVGNPAAGFFTYGAFWQRVTSARKVQYKVTNGSRLSLFVLGYGWTDPD